MNLLEEKLPPFLKLVGSADLDPSRWQSAYQVYFWKPADGKPTAQKNNPMGWVIFSGREFNKRYFDDPEGLKALVETKGGSVGGDSGWKYLGFDLGK